jgi:fructose-bisphosphate aldolase class I
MDHNLSLIVEKIMAPKKGILAADESNKTAGKRLEVIGVENTEENRRKYRELFLYTKDVENYLSGVILFEETLWQKGPDGKTFPEHLLELGILPGIKVDESTAGMPGSPDESITKGMDDLSERVFKYKEAHVAFSKWRAVFVISENSPTEEAIHANATLLALYAKTMQEQGIVPIVEPEVLLAGNHTLEQSRNVTGQVLKILFEKLNRYKVSLPHTILKTSMVLPGSESAERATDEEVAKATVTTLKEFVPKELGGVVFLSGGQSPLEATNHLAAIARLEPLPWPIAFSYARALQEPALSAWQGKEGNFPHAQSVFMETLKRNSAADQGISVG